MSSVRSIDGSLYRPSGIDGGGGPPHDSDMEKRVASLEADVRVIRDTLSDIRVQLANIPTKDDVSSVRSDLSPVRADVAAIKATLDGKAPASSVAEIKGRVDSLPTMPKITALMGLGITLCTAILGLYHFGIVHKWW